MSSWRQTTKHVVCPAAAHLPILIPPVPKAATKPIWMSLSLSCCPPEIQQTASFSSFVFLSFLWSANYIFFKLSMVADLLALSFASVFLSFFLFPPKLKQITSHFPSLSCAFFSSCLILSACYWEHNSFTNFSCLWQLITQIKPPEFPLWTSGAVGVFLGIKCRRAKW